MDNQTTSRTPSATPRHSTNSKSVKGLSAGMVVCAILAVAGVGFGVYGLIESNQKSDQIAQMRVEISDKDAQIADFAADELNITDSDIEISDTANADINPVIESPEGKIFSVSYYSPYVYANGQAQVNLGLKSGELASCSVLIDTRVTNQNCTVSGITGPIYKVVSAGEGQSYGGEVAFILTDGTVQLININDIVNSGTATAQTIETGGPIVDFVTANVYFTDSPVGGYGTNILVRADGTYFPFGDLNQYSHHPVFVL